MVTGHYYLLITLVTAHIAADFLLQNKTDVKNKTKTTIFLKHILILTLFTYLLIGSWGGWLIAVIIAVSHAVIDRIKLVYNTKKTNELRYFLIDQTAHFVVIVCVVIIFGSSKPAESFWINQFGTDFLRVNIYVSGLIITILAGGIIIGMLVKPFLDQIEKEQKGLLNGGELIGRLERLLIFLFVILGEMTVVGFLIAAKSIFRFGELNDSENRKQAEYILIGTLYSFSWGFICSWSTKELILML